MSTHEGTIDGSGSEAGLGALNVTTVERQTGERTQNSPQLTYDQYIALVDQLEEPEEVKQAMRLSYDQYLERARQSQEKLRSPEIVQLTYDEFIKIVEKHTEECVDGYCRGNWAEAAFHMLTMARLMPAAMFPELDPDKPPRPMNSKVQVLTPQNVFDNAREEHPWARDYRASREEQDLLYPYSIEESRDPQQLAGNAMKYLKDKEKLATRMRGEELLAEMARIATMAEIANLERLFEKE